MTVAQLLAALRDVPQDWEVFHGCYEDGGFDHVELDREHQWVVLA